MRVRRSARGAGVSPFSFSFASTNASIGFATGAASFGTAGSLIGWKAQCCFGSGVGALARSSGTAAPALTHSASTATAAGGSGVLGGIGYSPSRFTDLTSLLFAGSPGTNTGPLSAPAFRPADVSRRRPALCFFGPWHE